MTNTPNLDITPISQSQAQKEVTANVAFDKLDMLQNNGVIEIANTPPGVPNDGDLYITDSSPTDDWDGEANKLAYYRNGAWTFTTPREGLLVWVADEAAPYVYTSGSFTQLFSALDLIEIAMLGVGGASPDATNKLSVNTPAVLFNRETDDIQVKLNKNAAGDDAAFLFQTGFSTRALIGLLGDDDFHFKVSPDGSTFHESFIIDKDDGSAAFQKFVCLSSPSTLTIASGVVTATKSSHKIDTESSASSDDLTTINGGVANAILVIQPADDARTVVIKHGTGNIKTKTAADVSLDAYGKSWMGLWDGFNWIEL
jgi:hypothetical protein